MRPGSVASGLGRMLLAVAVALALALPAAAAETVICKDGTTDEGGRGACRGHGGVDKKATAARKGGAAAPADKAAAEAKPEKKARKAKAEKPAEAKPAEAAAPAEGKAARKEKAPAGAAATVICKDGTTGEGGRGACRGHGGVDKKATAARAGGGATPAMPPPSPAAAAPALPASPATASPAGRAEPAGDKGPPTARCKDGTLSYAKHHTGACANHGGVAEWLDGTPKK